MGRFFQTIRSWFLRGEISMSGGMRHLVWGLGTGRWYSSSSTSSLFISPFLFPVFSFLLFGVSSPSFPFLLSWFSSWEATTSSFPLLGLFVVSSNPSNLLFPSSNPRRFSSILSSLPSSILSPFVGYLFSESVIASLLFFHCTSLSFLPNLQTRALQNVKFESFYFFKAFRLWNVGNIWWLWLSICEYILYWAVITGWLRHGCGAMDHWFGGGISNIELEQNISLSVLSMFGQAQISNIEIQEHNIWWIQI